MLAEQTIPFVYREYTLEPLSVHEIREVLAKLGVGPREVLRKNDKAYRTLGMDGSESDEALIDAMSTHPTLLQRPIAVLDDRAVVGRPPENLLDLVRSAKGYPAR